MQLKIEVMPTWRQLVPCEARDPARERATNQSTSKPYLSQNDTHPSERWAAKFPTVYKGSNQHAGSKSQTLVPVARTYPTTTKRIVAQRGARGIFGMCGPGTFNVKPPLAESFRTTLNDLGACPLHILPLEPSQTMLHTPRTKP